MKVFQFFTLLASEYKKIQTIYSSKKKNVDYGPIKYLPSFSKEWTNTIYAYNKDTLKNMPIHTTNINNIVKGYFRLYFKNNLFINKIKKTILLKKRILLKRIYVSDAEIKHTANKAIIVLYIFNPEFKTLRKKYNSINKKIKRILLRKYKLLYKRNINRLYKSFIKTNINSLFLSWIRQKKPSFVNYKLYLLKNFLNLKNLYSKKILSIFITKYYNKKKSHLRKYDYLYSLNEYKFNRWIFIPKLTSYLENILGKKIEYNIVNLKSITYHPDLFINVLISRLSRKKPIRIHAILSRLLGITKLPRVNIIKERALLKIGKNWNLINNRFDNLNITSNFFSLQEKNLNTKQLFVQSNKFNTRDNLDNLINEIQNFNLKKRNKIHPFIFNSIKYKNLGGMRLKLNGRLTKRYRADRAVHVLKWKGGLKDIDSSFKGLTSVLYRGNTNPNNAYFLGKGKRRIGSFALKGWISGK